MIGRLLQFGKGAGPSLPRYEKALGGQRGALFLRLAESLLLAAVYLLLYPTLRRLFAGTLSEAYIVKVTVAMAACHALRMALFHRSAVVIYTASYARIGALRLRIAEHLRALPLGAFQADRLAHVKSVLTEDLQLVGQMAGSLVGFFISAVGLPFFLAAGLAFLNVKLAAALVAGLLLCLPVYRWMHRFMARHSRLHFQNISQSSARLLEYVMGIKVLKSYGLTGKRFIQLETSLAGTRDSVLALELGAISFLVVLTLLVEFGFPLLLVCGTYAVLGGTVDVPTFLFALILSVRFYAPIQEAFALSTEFQYLNAALDRVDGVLSLPRQEVPERAERPRAFDIEFQNVSFRYEEGGAPVLQDVSLRIPEGSMTALVGPSGAGKTTVSNLAARFWDPDQGRVLIGGVDLRRMEADELLGDIAIVFQDVVLFHDTVRENIRMGRPQASDAEVEEAARRAQCHDFILRLPRGYETLIGEGGGRLSGGEKQRLSIARALLKDAPIVLLDEATASIDPSAEKDIQKAFAALSENKTLVVIAHKLATVTHADQIVVLEEGRIVQRGTHAELLVSGGLYKTMWESQAAAASWHI
ncbi:MAG: ABC transporter ATP-binding protein [Verrucomicrobium sp.]|nr:ABC transporter ATP-binding protein [Verrucomicrobium sp.]